MEQLPAGTGATPTPGASLTGYPGYPTPSIPAGAPPVAPAIVESGAPPGDVQAVVTAAVLSGDPAKMRQVAAQLRAQGQTLAAQSLESHATTVEVGLAAVKSGQAIAQKILSGGTQTGAPAGTAAEQVPPVVVGPPAGQPPAAQPPAAPPAEQPPAYPAIPNIPIIQDVARTIEQTFPGIVPGLPPGLQAPTPTPIWPVSDPVKYASAVNMNEMLIQKKPYTEDNAKVKAFQTTEGLTTDGLYGPGTARVLGERYGIVPAKPYYWSKTVSKVPAQKAEYKAAMLALAAKDPSRAEEWVDAANV